jgi:hypothetical protein
MDNDWTGVDGDSVRRRRPQTVMQVLVVLLGFAVVATSVLAWQLVPAGPAPARLHAPPRDAGRPGSRGNRPGRPVRNPATAPTTTTTTTTGPLRVVEIGDSLGVDLGQAMENTWSPADVQLTMAARSDTGLANSAYFNWPSALSGLLGSAHPQVVIVLMGANDLQSIVTGPTVLYEETPAWNAAYSARVTAIISESVHGGAHVLWVGAPAMQNAFINAGMTQINGIVQEVVARYPGEAAFLSANSVLAPAGSFVFDVNAPTGMTVQVRTPDGVHLMPAGADILAVAVAKVIADAWGMQVADQ